MNDLQNAFERIILASKSPRRKELLEKIGLTFEIVPAEGEEQLIGTEPCDIVMNLARQKAEEVFDTVCPDGMTSERILVIGADTVVVHKNRILGKPKTREEAYAMLSALAGDTHQVYTGVCLLEGKDAARTFYEKTDVIVSDITEEELLRYIDSGDPFDKAGGYGIQGEFGVFVEGISGDYNNVVGLPVSRLYRELKLCRDCIQTDAGGGYK